MHAAAPDIIQQLVREIETEFGSIPVLVMDLVPAVITHGGPGAIGIGFFE